MALSSLRSILFTSLFSLGVSSCGNFSYYFDLASQHLELLSHQQSIEGMLGDPALDAELRRKLVLSQRAREFALNHLRLPESLAYTSYVDLQALFVPEEISSEQNSSQRNPSEQSPSGQRETILYGVNASQPFAFVAKEWCDALTCQTSKTFFSKTEAEAEAAALQREGWDVAINYTLAYSTGAQFNNSLVPGYFSDPLTSEMIKWSDFTLVGTLFHELAHQIAYFENSALNEGFATFVEEEGLRQYVRLSPLQDKEKLARHIGVVRVDEQHFHEIVSTFRKRLELLYQSDLPLPAKRQKKEELFGRLRETVDEEAFLNKAPYVATAQRLRNNAYLLNFGEYHDFVDEFAHLYHLSGSWTHFYRQVREIATWSSARQERYLERLMKKRRWRR